MHDNGWDHSAQAWIADGIDRIDHRRECRVIDRAFRPLFLLGPETWGVASGWYRTRLQRYPTHRDAMDGAPQCGPSTG